MSKQTSPSKNLKIRLLTQNDLARVDDIEQQAYPLPWKKSAHQDCLDSGYPSLVLELDRRLIGYVIFNYLYDECHLMNIAIHPEFQRRGFAEQLLQAMSQMAREAEMVKILLEVRVSNLKAIKFYNKQGFIEIGQRKNYYRTENQQQNQGHASYEDAIVMEKPL